MIYQSTRHENLTATSTQAVLQGLAPDGGLYIRKELGGFDWRGVLALDTLGMAERILVSAGYGICLVGLIGGTVCILQNDGPDRTYLEQRQEEH